jgi:DNA segregation ATPase FtsK/SpoIIIE, S-DNA-T family
MRYWLSVESGAGAEPVDVALEVDEEATAGAVADALAAWLKGEPTGESWQLASRGKELPNDGRFIDSPIVHGQRVSLRKATTAQSSSPSAGLTLRIVEGPDVGKSFPLLRGTNEIGRSPGAEVPMSDPAVGWNHARIVVGDEAVLTDLGSKNGTHLDGRPLTNPEPIMPGQRIRFGRSVAELRGVTLISTHTSGGFRPFNRPPKLSPGYVPEKFVVPTPPAEPSPPRLSFVPAILPVAMAVTMYFVTKKLLSGLFLAFSPIMVFGNYFENKKHNLKLFEKATAEFRNDLSDLRREIELEQAAEAEALRIAYPSVSALSEAIDRRTTMLWSRAPEDREFAEIRIGLGERPTRVEFDVRDGGARQFRPDVAAIPDRYAVLADVPMTASLRAGGIGVSGTADAVDAMVRSIIMQLAASHSPAELVIAAIFDPEGAAAWDWIKWLPHTRSATSPIEGSHLGAAPQAVESLVRRLRDIAETRSEGVRTDTDYEVGPDDRAQIVLVIHRNARVNRVLLAELMEQGPRAGISFVWIGARHTDLPRTCTWVIDVGQNTAVLGDVEAGRTLPNIRAELLDAPTAVAGARALAPVQDESRRSSYDLDIPSNVSLVGLLGGPRLLTDPAFIVDRWGDANVVATPLGLAPGSTFSLDLRLAGPHGFVVGTTGSGKSELLRSLLVGLAASIPPQHLNFLLIDFKGGAGLRPFLDLPHTVGLVTNLQDGSADADAILEARVQRTLTWLRAEVQRRFRLFEQLGVSDLADLERVDHADRPPRLLIVADEFAVLSSRSSKGGGDVIDDMVNVARLGRSLGIHLLLATQRASGVITDNIRANTNLKIALRVQDTVDSKEVIGTNQAALISQKAPGRAFVAIGANEPVELQTASSQGHSLEGPGLPVIELDRFVVATSDELSETWSNQTGRQKPQGLSDLDALVKAIGEAAYLADQRGRFIPWVDQPPAVIPLNGLRSPSVEGRVSIGLCDQPSLQQRVSFELDLPSDGSFMLFGAPSSGKTIALLSIAGSIARNNYTSAFAMYAVDSGSMGLAPLRGLPHVGAVVAGDDHERITRLFATLRATIASRVAAFDAAGVSSLAELRRARPGSSDLARIVLLLDDTGSFVEAYKDIDHSLIDQLSRLASDGRQAGVHVIATADRRGAITSTLASAFRRRVVLRMANDDEYLNVNTSPRQMVSPPPGRAIVDGAEVQLAIPMTAELGRTAESAALAADEARLNKCAVQAGEGEQLVRAFEEIAQNLDPTSILTTIAGVGVLPEEFALDSLVSSQSWSQPVLGMTERGLVPVRIDLTQFSFVVAGPPGSGKSTAMATLARSVSSARSGGVDVMFASGRPGASLPAGSWKRTATGEPELIGLLDDLIASTPLRQVPVVVFIDDLTEVTDKSIDSKLLELLRLARQRSDIRVVVSGDVADVRRAYQGTALAEIKRYKQALLLQPDIGQDGGVVEVQLPRRPKLVLPPGRAFLVRRGNIELVHVAQ